MGTRTYKDILRSELITRIGRNSKYSLRAFARDLGLRPSHLSQILNDKKGVSQALASQIGLKLNLPNNELQYFLDSVESIHGRHEVVRQNAMMRVHRFLNDEKCFSISLDHFSIISDWYHFALLELLKLDSYSRAPKDMARALGITEEVVMEAISRLRRVGLLESGDDLLPNSKYHGISSEVPAAAIQAYHAQILNIATAAIKKQSVTKRDFSAITVAIDKAKIPEVKAKIRKFQEDMGQYLESSDGKDSVYCLSVQFFDLLAQEDSGQNSV